MSLVSYLPTKKHLPSQTTGALHSLAQVDAQRWPAGPCSGEVRYLAATLTNQNSLQLLQVKSQQQAQYKAS